MSRNCNEQFVYELENIKQGISYHGHNCDILQIVWSLKNEVKNFYSINSVPQEIVKSLEELESMFKFAEKALEESVNLISQRIQKDEGMIDGRYP